VHHVEAFGNVEIQDPDRIHDVFSAHADIAALVDFVSFPELEQVIIVHGDDSRDARLGLKEALEAFVDWPDSVQIVRP